VLEKELLAIQSFKSGLISQFVSMIRKIEKTVFLPWPFQGLWRILLVYKPQTKARVNGMVRRKRGYLPKPVYEDLGFC
jgi:hypothetical protein